ncbi:MAG: ArsR/SmtB family transcription factor [Pyrinomonadaceae bacterium]
MPNAKNRTLSPEAVRLVAARFKLLSEPIRIQILHSLHDGPLNVTDISNAVGASQPNASKHLKLMQDAGLISRRQEGNVVYYAIADASVFELCDVVCSSLKQNLTKTRAILG